MANGYLAKVQAWILENDLIQNNEPLLCAVSGGKDSVCMCLILKELGYNFAIAHVNFQLRGTESDDDEIFVESFAKSLGVPVFSIKFNTHELAQPGESIQLAARRLRYEWFKELCEKQGFKKICTAHSANDNAETLIYNLSKGTGLKGLVGIPLKNENIIRPILCLETHEIEAFLKLNNTEYRNDSSNATTKYARNKIRHKILPVLKEINNDIINTFGLHSGRFRQIEGLYRQIVQEKQAIYFTWNYHYWEIDLEKLAKETFHLNLINEWFLPFGFSQNALENIIDAQTGSCIYSHDFELHKDRNTLLFAQRILPTVANIEIKVDENGTCELENGFLSWKRTKNPDLKLLKQRDFAFIDAKKIGTTMHIRPIENGCYFQPYGLKGKTLVSDYLTNLKRNKIEKNAAIMLYYNNLPVWLVDERIDDAFKIDDKTETFLVFQWTKKTKKPFPYFKIN